MEAYVGIDVRRRRPWITPPGEGSRLGPAGSRPLTCQEMPPPRPLLGLPPSMPRLADASARPVGERLDRPRGHADGGTAHIPGRLAGNHLVLNATWCGTRPGGR